MMRKGFRTPGSFVLLVAAVLVLLGLSACSSLPGVFGSEVATGAPGTELRVGMAANYPPLSFKRDGQLTGVEAEFAQELEKELGVTITPVETPWKSLIPALREQRIDVIMSGMSITEERKQLVGFTEPYFEIGQMAVVRNVDYERLRNAATINQIQTTIGVVQETTGEGYVRTHFARATVETFASVDDGITALRRGLIDVFVHDAPAIWKVSGRPLLSDQELTGIYTPLTKEDLAWAVRKDDSTLRKRLNEVLAKWKNDGTLEDVLDHWIPVRKTTIPLPGQP